MIDAGDAVSGATVSAKGSHKSTNGTGHAKVTISGSSGQHVTVTISDGGYQTLKRRSRSQQPGGRQRPAEEALAPAAGGVIQLESSEITIGPALNAEQPRFGLGVVIAAAALGHI